MAIDKHASSNSTEQTQSDVTDHQSLKLELAKAIRDPNFNHSFEQRRIAIYQELFFNNIEGFCGSGFPVLKSIFVEETSTSLKSMADFTEANLWLSLVRRFLIFSENHSPYFVDIAEQFLTFLAQDTYFQKYLEKFLWALELAHYEWVELNVSLQDLATTDLELQNLKDFITKATNRFKVADSAWALAYQYPVHTISSKVCDVIEPTPTFLVVYLNEEHEVAFIQTNAHLIQLLNCIETRESVDYEYLDIWFTKNHPSVTKADRQTFLNDALRDCVTKGIIICQA